MQKSLTRHRDFDAFAELGHYQCDRGAVVLAEKRRASDGQKVGRLFKPRR